MSAYNHETQSASKPVRSLKKKLDEFEKKMKTQTDKLKRMIQASNGYSLRKERSKANLRLIVSKKNENKLPQCKEQTWRALMTEDKNKLDAVPLVERLIEKSKCWEVELGANC